MIYKQYPFKKLEQFWSAKMMEFCIDQLQLKGHLHMRMIHLYYNNIQK